jgi:acetyltransferase-like isoleucine patch superfamily enzyme
VLRAVHDSTRHPRVELTLTMQWVDRAARALTKARRRAIGLLWRAWISTWGGTVGKRLEIDSGARLRWPPHSGISIGDDVYIGIGAVIDAPRGSRLTLADGVKLMHHTVVATSNHISVGSKTQVAECSSIRDSDHGLGRDSLIRDQPVLSAPVQIGSDVWIGRGVAVLRGSTIGDGAVLGANCVVRTEIPPFAIAVGVPARVIRVRS